MSYEMNRGLGVWGVATSGQESNFYGMNDEGQACENKNNLFADGYTGPNTGPWQYGGMWVTGPLVGPLGPVQPGGAQPATVYPILIDANCKPYADTSRPTQNPMVAIQAAATAADAKLIANTAAGVTTATPTPASQVTTPQGAAIINSSGASSGAATPPPVSSDWFTESMFGGIPNWGLLAAAAVAAFFVMKGGK